MVEASGHILLEGAPQELDTRDIGPDLVANVPGLDDVHHVHVWSITQERRMVTLHACACEGQDGDRVGEGHQAAAQGPFGLDHATDRDRA